MNTLNGLKKLLAKLGGNPDAVNNNGDAVDAIAEAYADHVGAVIDDTKASEDTVYSSSKVESLIPEGLPTVSSKDKFKIMQVNTNGQWSKIDLINCFYKGIFIPGDENNTVQLFNQLTEIELGEVLFTSLPIGEIPVFCTQIQKPGGGHFPAKYQGIIRETGKTTYYTLEVADNTPLFTDIPVTVTVVNDPT